MENKKDLSKAFAIIFGIKPEEVPNKSSGVKIEKEANEPLITSNEMLNVLTTGNREDFKNLMTKIIDGQTNNIKNKALKERQEQLKQYPNMENSKSLTGIDNMKGMARDSGLLPVDSNKYMEVGYIDEKPIKNEKTKYQVNFKIDKSSVLISENMVNELMIYDSRSNINGYNTSLNLLWASDEDTGEMICLDSSSILSITKFK